MEQKKVYRIEDNFGWKSGIIDDEYIAYEKRYKYLQTSEADADIVLKVVCYLMTLTSEEELEAQKKDILGDKK